MDTKHLTTRAVLKADGDAEGSIEAVFSTFNVIDRGNDIVLPDAIPNGKSVPMVWNHDWNQPIGRGEIHVEEDRAVFKGRFFTQTTQGRNAYETVKAMGDLQEYSWGFLIEDSEYIKKDGKTVRVIKSTWPYEISPTLVGEGLGTHTLAIKGGLASGLPYGELVKRAEADLIAIASLTRERADIRNKDGRRFSKATLDTLSAIIESLDSLSGIAGELRSLIGANEEETEEGEKSLDIDVDAMLAGLLAMQATQMGATRT